LGQFDTTGFVTLVRDLWGDRVQGILHTLNDDKGDRVEARSGSTQVLWGDEHLVERINSLDFSMSMSSFFQTNPASAERLYDKVVEYVGQPDQADGVILDLFCGTGTIAQLLARQSAHEVIGVDLVESAIDDAARNAELNQLTRVKFFAADAGKFLSAHPEYAGRIASLVLDPPRAGIAPKTLQKVIDLGAKKMVYVSCNPATQARDAQTLAEAGYQMTRMTLVDQFPHTAHIEAVATFEKA
jgi:23S rRNA (uracil-5-)-methyltransferase RumA